MVKWRRSRDLWQCWARLNFIFDTLYFLNKGKYEVGKYIFEIGRLAHSFIKRDEKI